MCMLTLYTSPGSPDELQAKLVSFLWGDSREFHENGWCFPMWMGKNHCPDLMAALLSMETRGVNNTIVQFRAREIPDVMKKLNMCLVDDTWSLNSPVFTCDYFLADCKWEHIQPTDAMCPIDTKLVINLNTRMNTVVYADGPEWIRYCPPPPAIP
jgi:hypothetical protein